MSGRSAPMRDIAARNALVEANMGLIDCAWRTVRHVHDVARLGVQDAFQAGALGLIKAAELWDEARGTQFSTYAVPAIRRAILAAARLQKLVQVPLYLQDRDSGYAPPSMFEVSEAIPDHDAPDPGDLFAEVEDREAWAERVLEAMAELPEDCRRVMRARFWQGLTLSETARRLGITRESVRATQRRAMRFLREALARKLELSA